MKCDRSVVRSPLTLITPGNCIVAKPLRCERKSTKCRELRRDKKLLFQGAGISGSELNDRNAFMKVWIISSGTYL
jgi:hypothetical protein